MHLNKLQLRTGPTTNMKGCQGEDRYAIAVHLLKVGALQHTTHANKSSKRSQKSRSSRSGRSSKSSTSWNLAPVLCGTHPPTMQRLNTQGQQAVVHRSTPCSAIMQRWRRAHGEQQYTAATESPRPHSSPVPSPGNLPATHNMTRHDTTRHDTTRHDMT
jgi:hypothetical protein